VDDSHAEEARRILGLLAEPERLRVLAAVVLGHNSIGKIVRATGVDDRRAEKALARLVAGELLIEDGAGGYRVAVEQLKATARASAPEPEAGDIAGAPPDAARVLRTFFRGSRLTAIPAQRSKRVVVLNHIVQDFEPGNRYKEAEVNDILRRHHDDVASLRRYLVDEGLMTRAAGIYWRSGGTFEVE